MYLLKEKWNKTGNGNKARGEGLHSKKFEVILFLTYVNCTHPTTETKVWLKCCKIHKSKLDVLHKHKEILCY